VIDINDIDNPEYYYNHDKGLAFCKSIPEVSPIPTIFHLYWGNSEIRTIQWGRKHNLCVKSIFATQPKDTEIYVWSNRNLMENESFREISSMVKFRIINVNEEAKDLKIPHHILHVANSDPYSGSDLVRLILLHNYGGVWLDCDTIVLRDFSPLLDQQFCYKWEFFKTEATSAVLHLWKNGEAAKELIKQLIITPRRDVDSWTRELVGVVANRRNDLKILPCMFFDCKWTTFDLGGIFQADVYNNNELYDGAFTYQWHSQWDFPIEPGCRFEQYEAKINKLLKGE